MPKSNKNRKFHWLEHGKTFVSAKESNRLNVFLFVIGDWSHFHFAVIQITISILRITPRIRLNFAKKNRRKLCLRLWCQQ